MPPRPLPVSGGPEPAHQEIVFAGPYRGFDSDTSQWYLGEGGIFDEVSNIDFLKGQAQTRPGITTVTADMTALTDATASGQPYKNTSDVPLNGGMMLYDGGGSSGVSNKVYGVSQFWYYRLGAVTPFSSIGGGVTNKYQIRYVTGLASTLNGDPAVTGAATLWTSEHLVGGYFKIDADADSAWSLITAVSGAGALTLSAGYPGATVVNGAYTIVIPTCGPDYDGTYTGTNTHSDLCPIPSSGAPYYAVGISGWYGSYYDSGAGHSILQSTLPRYKANCMAYFANRLFLGTNFRIDALNGTPVRNFGRVAYSANGSFQDYTASSAGAFDLDCAGICWLIVMRDVLYAFSSDAIWSIQKTGNSVVPFRAQKLFDGLRFQTRWKPVVVDNAYMVLVCFDGPYKFDGSSISPLGEGLSEYFRGTALYAPTGVTASGFSAYDQYRQRVWFAGSAAGATTGKLICFDLKAKGWSVWENTTEKFVGVMPINSTPSGNAPDTELIAVGIEGTVGNFVKFSRTVNTDDVPSASTGITWSMTTPVLDAQTSRFRKSCDKIRVVYECSGTAETISVSLFTDGGTTAAWTKNLALVGGTAGQIKNAFLPFTPVTGQFFSVKLSGTTDTKVKITQIAISIINRTEERIG